MAELGFKALCKEMKEFFGVSSLEKVARELGYKESAAVGWRGRKAFSENAISQYELLRLKAGLDSDYQSSKITKKKTQSRPMTGAEFKEIREQLGMTQDELSKATGINIRQISRIETGVAEVRDYQEKLILALLKKDKGDLADSDTIQIPIYDVSASAGEGAVNDERLIEHIIVSKIALKAFFNLSNTQNLSIITARGDSMEPTIPQGSHILVQQREVMEGEICVCRVGDELYVKRLQKLPRFVLLSDNPRYEAIPLTSRDFEIIGAVVGVFIKFVR